ncbi:oleosin 1 [Eucalyptus grandis]|nr:oleosin 1 [Eucalyptus grandis]
MQSCSPRTTRSNRVPDDQHPASQRHDLATCHSPGSFIYSDQPLVPISTDRRHSHLEHRAKPPSTNFASGRASDGATMSDQRHRTDVTHVAHQGGPPARQAVKVATATTIGGALLVLSGLTLTGTVLALIVATPIMVLFSPILVPAGIAVALITAGFLASGGFGAAAATALTWMYRYFAGKHPAGEEQVEYARAKIADTARDVKEKAKEYGQYVQHKAQEVTGTA